VQEREALALVAAGLSQNKRGALLITERPVEAHVQQIFHKLGLQADADSHRCVLAVLAHVRDATQPLKSTAKPAWPVDAPAGFLPSRATHHKQTAGRLEAESRTILIMRHGGERRAVRRDGSPPAAPSAMRSRGRPGTALP
jgi:hypothetical protein